MDFFWHFRSQETQPTKHAEGSRYQLEWNPSILVQFDKKGEKIEKEVALFRSNSPDGSKPRKFNYFLLLFLIYHPFLYIVHEISITYVCILIWVWLYLEQHHQFIIWNPDDWLMVTTIVICFPANHLYFGLLVIDLPTELKILS